MNIMSKNDPIMQRMKENYEMRSRTSLTRRTPVMMRLDGKAFHTYTRGLDKPFDEGLIEDMTKTAEFLCSEIQGAKCAYVQSDEISILITDYDKLNTSAWFDYQVQKMCSIGAALATAKFNQLRFIRLCNSVEIPEDQPINHLDLYDKLAFFDARVFNIPKEEVPNYFHARQRDAVKNSISMLAQSMFSTKELHGKNTNEMQDMVFKKSGQNWNDLHYSKKRGTFVVKQYREIELTEEEYNKRAAKHEKNGTVSYLCWRIDKDQSGPYRGGRYYDKRGRSYWSAIETPMSFNNEMAFTMNGVNF